MNHTANKINSNNFEANWNVICMDNIQIIPYQQSITINVNINNLIKKQKHRGGGDYNSIGCHKSLSTSGSFHLVGMLVTQVMYSTLHSSHVYMYNVMCLSTQNKNS